MLLIFFSNYIYRIIEKANNEVSHPKDDFLKELTPKYFVFLKYFCLKLHKLNHRKSQKWGKPPQKLLIKKNDPPNFISKIFFFFK